MTTKDVNDILGSRKDALTSSEAVTKSTKVTKKVVKRPNGMSRELYNLFTHGPNEHELRTVDPSDRKSGYSQIKANIGFRRTRHWEWKPFVNEARTDKLRLCHWEREDRNPNEEYVFAKFNKHRVETVKFNDEDFDRVLKGIAGNWTLEATRHLLELCERFDLRWIVIDDRFDRTRFGRELLMEDLKDWYYKLTNMIKADKGIDEPAYIFDAEHEKKRKEQLELLWNRTNEEIKEEEHLKSQMKKLEAKRKEREKRAQDLQRLINTSERSSAEPDVNGALASTHQKSEKRKAQKNRSQNLAAQLFTADGSTNLRFSEFRSAGPHLRSHEMKLPSNVGQKKLKIIDAAVDKYKLQIAPPAYEEVVRAYNDFRTKVVYAQELRTALQAAQQDLDLIPKERVSEPRQSGDHK